MHSSPIGIYRSSPIGISHSIPHRDKSFIPHRDSSEKSDILSIPPVGMHGDMPGASNFVVSRTGDSFIPHRRNSPLVLTQRLCLMFTPIEPHLRPTSSLKPKRWRNLLQHYPDSRFPELLSGIATYGARAGYEGPFLRIRGLNHSSVFRISDDISVNIQAEVSAGKVLELPSLPQFYVISPLGAVEKRANGTRTGWRRIHDLSFPNGVSVNDGIPSHYGTLMYQTLDDAMRLIGHHGRRVVLRKRDLRDAFRMIPLSPLDYWLFVFEWQEKLYIDIFLPFGLRTSPFIFNLFSEGLHWIEAIHPLQLIFLTAALNDIELISEWLSTKENWIADAPSRFQIDKVANLFPQFQHPFSQHRRETGKPMSELRAQLRTFFGMDSLPELEPDTLLPSNSLNVSPLDPDVPRSLHPSHFSQAGTRTWL